MESNLILRGKGGLSIIELPNDIEKRIDSNFATIKSWRNKKLQTG